MVDFDKQYDFMDVVDDMFENIIKEKSRYGGEA